MSLPAFYPQGNTILIAATTTATAARQVSTGSHHGCHVAITGSTQHVFIAFGASTATAALPTTAAAAAGMVVHPNTYKTLSIPPNAYTSVITASGTANVWITPGSGE